MLNIQRLPQKERVYRRNVEETGFKLLIRFELKNTAWIEETVQKFSTTENLVVNTCAWIFFVARA